jgi:hypothetical protein
MYGLIALPQAKGFLPVGSSQEDCIKHNRFRKAVVTALRLVIEGTTSDQVTADDMARAELWSGVKAPGSDETRQLIVTMMRFFEATPIPVATVAATVPQAIVPVGLASRFRAALRRHR